jgi:hypothetical protein
VSFRYEAPRTVSRFMLCDDFVRGIMGPIGSGKSTGCVMEVYKRCVNQRRGPDGIRKSRWVVVRNTYRELNDTTVKTFLSWFPEGLRGHMDWQDMTYTWRFEDVDAEVMFRALDRPQDVKKLLSLEATGFWFNEAREIPKAVVDMATGRVGRYPSMKDGGASWFGIIMDTNPPDTDHWWYRIFEEDRPSGWSIFKQPSALAQDAENIRNLPPNYYQNLMAGKREEWIKVYVKGEYGFVLDGKPVFPEYVDSIHCREFEFDPRLPLFAGIDFGLTPAAAIGQRDFVGRWRWRHEIVTEHMGAKRFGEQLQAFISQHLPGYVFEAITGDPAGTGESQADESTPFQMLKACGIHAKPAHTNDPTLRREAIAVPMGKLIDGQPGFLIHPDMRTARKGFSGGYHFARVQVAGDERYHDKPVKNFYSHIIEANEYGMLGGGEGKLLIRAERKDHGSRPKYAHS